MIDYCMFLETVTRRYHANIKDYALTLGDILTIESDTKNVSYDKFVMKFMLTEEGTVGHITQHLSENCFSFVEDGGHKNA